MKITLTFLVFVSFQIYSQSTIKPFIQLGYYQTFTDDLYMSEIELGVGVEINNYLST